MSRRGGLAMLAVLASLTTASAAPEAAPGPSDLAAELDVLSQAASVEAALAIASEVRARFGLAGASPGTPRPTPEFTPEGAPVVEMVDMRLLLAQIAVQTGARDHLVLARAQNAGSHQVILLRGGLVTLDRLTALAAGTPAAAFVTTGEPGVTLTRPMVVWPDAGLHLGAADRLVLSRADGSFLVNLGWLDIQGASVRGTESRNPREAAFRPFLLTAGTGSLTVSGSRFAHLGFGKTQRFGGVSVVSAGLQQPRTPPTVQHSRFDDVASLSMIGTLAAEIRANRISAGGILIARSAGSLVAGNLLTQAAGQAIRVSSGSGDTRIDGNIVLGGPVGVAVDQASRRVTLSGNVLVGQAGSAIRLDKADCVEIAGNLTALGAGSGLSLSDTGRVNVTGNAILDHGKSGILLRGQRGKARVLVTGNLLAGNHEGLRGATAGSVSLSGNDMEGQLPRLFSGDMAARTIPWLEARKASGKPEPRQAATTPVCPPEGNI